jgi:hypothetical protein
MLMNSMSISFPIEDSSAHSSTASYKLFGNAPYGKPLLPHHWRIDPSPTHVGDERRDRRQSSIRCWNKLFGSGPFWINTSKNWAKDIGLLFANIILSLHNVPSRFTAPAARRAVAQVPAPPRSARSTRGSTIRFDLQMNKHVVLWGITYFNVVHWQRYPFSQSKARRTFQRIKSRKQVSIRSLILGRHRSRNRTDHSIKRDLDNRHTIAPETMKQSNLVQTMKQSNPQTIIHEENQ